MEKKSNFLDGDRTFVHCDRTIIYTYRYMWQTNKKGALNKTFIKMLSAPEVEHKQFVDLLAKDKTVTMASRMYVCEYDVSKLDMPDTIKKLKKDGEKDEKNKDQ